MTQKPCILVIEDSKDQAERYLKLLARDYEVVLTMNLEEARSALNQRHFYAALSDIHLNSASSKADYQGLEIISEVLQSNPETLMLVMSADPEVDTFRRAMSLGADFFIKKPIVSRDELKIALESAHTRRLQLRASKINQSKASTQLDRRFEDGLVLEDEIRKLAKNVARSKTLPVVIYGETGTGKEELAKLIHKKRQEIEGSLPFVAVNCANLHHSTAVSQLFGHRKGAFTGADQTTSGYIGDANGGILFLDEIHRLNDECQGRLLRVLNDGSYERLGESKPLFSHFQVIAASSHDLDELVSQGSFLMDLRSRLIGADFFLAPLREKREHIRDLIELFFLKENYSISHDELEKLILRCQEFYWQGNIRQLINVLKSFCTLCTLNEEAITASSLPVFKTMLNPKTRITQVKDESRSHPSHQFILGALYQDQNFKNSVESYEKLLLQEALMRHKTVGDAVAALEMSRSSFDMKKKKYGLS